MLRIYKDDRKGATAFFRNRPLLQTLARLLAKEKKTSKIKVFFHACSIGAEPYSFGAFMFNRPRKVIIDATDIEQSFIDFAKQGVYPAQITDHMSAEEKKWFAPVGDNQILLAEKIRKKVRFLSPLSVLDPVPGKYDIVFAMNVLTYIAEEEQQKALALMAASARKMLCVTAFHPDSIKVTLEKLGFEPVLDNQQEIHNSWGDRVRPGGASPGSPEYSWVIPPYNTDCQDYTWRYCSLFRRKKN